MKSYQYGRTNVLLFSTRRLPKRQLLFTACEKNKIFLLLFGSEILNDQESNQVLWYQRQQNALCRKGGRFCEKLFLEASDWFAAQNRENVFKICSRRNSSPSSKKSS